MLINIFNFFLSITEGLGYMGVFILMVVESSFIPMPSEIIIPPAAYLASLGKMNIFLIIVLGVLGSLVGAIFNYFLAYYLGRPVIYRLANHRIARFFLLNPEKIKRAEEYFLNNSKSATFIGRLIPVIRQLISLPAGFCRMPFGWFVFYTTIGSFLWVSLLAGLGYFLGQNQELLEKYYNEIAWVLIIFGVIWFLVKIIKIQTRKSITKKS